MKGETDGGSIDVVCRVSSIPPGSKRDLLEQSSRTSKRKIFPPCKLSPDTIEQI